MLTVSAGFKMNMDDFGSVVRGSRWFLGGFEWFVILAATIKYHRKCI